MLCWQPARQGEGYMRPSEPQTGSRRGPQLQCALQPGPGLAYSCGPQCSSEIRLRGTFSSWGIVNSAN